MNDTHVEATAAARRARCARPGSMAVGSSAWAITRSGAIPRSRARFGRAVSKKARRHAGEPHLQIRFQRRPLHLSVERQVRLPVALAVGCRSAEVCGADEADAAWLDEAKANGIKKTFITFHYPVFGRSGLGPIPAPNNPHKLIASYAKDMEMIVFNGHVHTTEIFEVDGVKYLMLAWRGGTGPDPSWTDEHQSARRLSARTSIGRVSRPKRSTTTRSSMSNRARRQGSPSIASGPGRPNHSQARAYSPRRTVRRDQRPWPQPL